MLCNLYRGIAVSALLTVGAIFASQASAAADEIIQRDDHGRITKTMSIPPGGVNEGLKITGYAQVDGNDAVRMSAVGKSTETDATYYRPNGSRETMLVVTNCLTQVYWYDQAGEKILFRQIWFKGIYRDENYARSPVQHHYQLWAITEMDDKGVPKRDYQFFPLLPTLQLQSLTRYDEKIPGDSLLSWYRSDGTLDADYYQPSPYLPYTKTAKAAPEGSAAPEVPVRLTQLPPHLDEDDFPTIPEVSGGLH